VICFALPRPAERLALWKRGMSPRAPRSGVDLAALAETHKLSGGAVAESVHGCSIRCE
jgi:hypothetical protein